MCKDIHGRMYAKVSEVKVGTCLECDGGFTCMEKGRVNVVKANEGGLYIVCNELVHGLDGQIAGDEDDEYYVGLYCV